MKYTLINCYSDRNKGDLGIILSTIRLLKVADPTAKVSCISTYNFSDPLFTTEHKILRGEVPVLPAIFGELNLFSSKSVISKFLRLVIDILRICVYLASPKKVLPIIESLFFSRQECNSLNSIDDTDFVISKGGSFLCDESNLQSKIAFFRFLFIFFVAIKKSKRIIILAQSLGPVNSKINCKLLNYVLRKSHSLVLREDTCISEYKYIKIPSSTIVINDIAFFINDSGWSSFDFECEENRLNIGFTIKFVEKQYSTEYLEMFKSAIEHVITKYNAIVHIFPHVNIENDLQNAYNVLSLVDDSVKANIRIYSGDYDARTLKVAYSKMDYFVGTRLHSTIFAMSELVPSICITYHGTKALGIFKNFLLEDYVIIKYSDQILIEKIESIMQNRLTVVSKIRQTLEKNKEDFISFLKALN